MRSNTYWLEKIIVIAMLTVMNFILFHQANETMASLLSITFFLSSPEKLTKY